MGVLCLAFIRKGADLFFLELCYWNSLFVYIVS